MQCMTGTERKTIFHKLFVLRKYSSLNNFIATIGMIIEKRMPNMLHVHPYLVSAASFEPTFHKGYVIEFFEHFIMSDRIFTVITFRISGKQFSKPLMPSNMRNDGAFRIFEISPHNGNIAAMYCMVKKLFSQFRHGYWSLCHYQKSACILINAMHQPEA